MSWFDFIAKGSKTPDMIDIFPMPIELGDFVSIDLETTYKRILIDVMERTHGLPKDAVNLIWDNCLASEQQDGLLSMVAKAMVAKSDLYLVYLPAIKLIRKANAKEEQQIRTDYKESGESSVGVYITFKNYKKTDMLKFYSSLEYCSVGGLWKQSNISKAIQFKIKDLRAGVGLVDKEIAKEQATKMAEALAQGKDLAMDGGDIIETAKPDMSATKAAADFIVQKQSYYLGLPATYLLGDQSTGLGDSGKKDSKAIDKGLKAYYFSIAKPIVEGIFKVNTEFKSEDGDGLEVALKVLETMDATSSQYLSDENKTLIVNKAFGLDADEVGDGEPDADTNNQSVPPRV